ncbi:adenylate/guanylate cyclase domain-containing protein [Caldicellulosiruptor acetigenus]|uniref:adenylate/guanylate cyclase domain-containing protein n=1 Tax=Caldicellulosiruptor acetigenus TaxID=301953 RepID=UPI001E5D1710|nr:adenylate/guanylate cyclase domain-containing protein [Caldicellulosiruptor acetigenus]WAM37061.1 tetratricopeptide repeat protein [Caldicellulosiruptor acetigenus]
MRLFCFNCGSKLQEKLAQKCVVCGIKFDKFCQNCTFPVPSFANFCPNCGSYITKSREYFRTEELKKVAVMFADVSGFTKFSEKLSPDEVKKLINEFFEFILKPVYNLNGIVDKFIGDCALILFGLKSAQMDAPLRSVLCALEMLKLSKEFSKTKNVELSLSIGINYGLVAVGKIGGLFEKDYTVMGDVVNTAQRLQTAAPPDTIYVSENVYKETYENIEYIGPIELNVKNKSQMVRCYIPINTSKQVDYNKVVETLTAKYTTNVIDSIVNRSSDFLVIVCPDGCGKRYIFQNIISKLERSNLRYYFISLSNNNFSKPFYLLSLLILKILNVNFEDSVILKKNRLISFLDYLFKEDYKMAERCFNYLSLVLQIDLNEDFKQFLSYMTQEDIEFKIFEVISSFLKKIFESEFAVVIIDNINFADKESFNFILDFLSKQLQNKPFFIFSSSSEVHKVPKGLHFKIQKLSNEEIKTAVEIQFNAKEVEESSLHLLMNISEGKLDYLIETLKWLDTNKLFSLSNGIFKINLSQQNIESIRRNIILDKLSNIDDEVLEYLKIAAVYGYRFSSKIIFNILQPKIEHTYLLSQVQKLNLIRLIDTVYNSNFTDKIYEFVEPEIVKILLDFIPQQTKRMIHLKIATTIEKMIAQKDLTIYYETLYYHFKEAGEVLRAANYLFELAMQYKKMQLGKFAVEWLYKLLDEIKAENSPDCLSLFVSSLEQLAALEKSFGNYEKALQHYNKLFQFAKTDEEKFLLETEICECVILQNNFKKAEVILNELQKKLLPSNFARTKVLYLQCLYKSYTGSSDLLMLVSQLEAALKESNNFEDLAQILNIVSYSLYTFTSETKKVILYLKKALNYANKSKNLLLKAKILTNLGILNYENGNPSEALKFLTSAFELAKVLSNRHLQLILLNNIGIIYFEKGLLKKALENFSEAFSYAHEWKLVYEECITLQNIAELYLEKGNIIESYNLFSQSFDLANKFNFIPEKALSLIGMAKAMLEKSNLSGAEEFLNEALNALSENKENRVELEYLLAKTKLHLLQNDIEQATTAIEQAMKTVEQLKNLLIRIKTFRMYSQVLKHKKEFNKALETLKMCEKLASQTVSFLEFAKIYYEIANIHLLLGNKKEFEESIKLASLWAEKIDEECSIKFLIMCLLNKVRG